MPHPNLSFGHRYDVPCLSSRRRRKFYRNMNSLATNLGSMLITECPARRRVFGVGETEEEVVVVAVVGEVGDEEVVQIIPETDHGRRKTKRVEGIMIEREAMTRKW
jgi:hypothetical protein